MKGKFVAVNLHPPPPEQLPPVFAAADIHFAQHNFAAAKHKLQQQPLTGTVTTVHCLLVLLWQGTWLECTFP